MPQLNEFSWMSEFSNSFTFMMIIFVCLFFKNFFIQSAKSIYFLNVYSLSLF